MKQFAGHLNFFLLKIARQNVPLGLTSNCQKLLSSVGHFEFPAGHLIEFNIRPLPDIWYILPDMSGIFGNH